MNEITLENIKTILAIIYIICLNAMIFHVCT